VAGLPDDRLTQHLAAILRQAIELRAKLQVDERLERYSNNDLRMDEYNQLRARTRVLLPEDRLLASLPELPDAVMRAFGTKASADMATTRTESCVTQIVNQIEFRFPGLSPKAPIPIDVASLGPLTTDERRAIDEVSGLSSVSEPIGLVALEFSWVEDPRLREVVRRDYREAQLAFAAGAFKGAALLLGSVVEGMSLDVITRPATTNSSKFKAATRKVPTKEGALNWDAVGAIGLVEILVTLGWVPASTLKFAQGTADYRDTIHPRAELRLGLRPKREEVGLMLALVPLLDRNLSTAKPSSS